MRDDYLILFIIGIFVFLVYWFVHGMISYWIYRDSSRRGAPAFGWVGTYIGLTFFNMLLWITVLILPLLKQDIKLPVAIIISVLLATLSLPSLFTLLFYSLSKREFGLASVYEGAALRRKGVSLDKTIRYKVTEIATDAELINLKCPDPHVYERLPLNVGETTFGSSAGNHVSLSRDRDISKKHAKIEKKDDKYFLSDVGSKKGIWIERKGEKIEVTKPTELEADDVICLSSDSRFEFKRK
jgi:hypothetical protein